MEPGGVSELPFVPQERCLSRHLFVPFFPFFPLPIAYLSFFIILL